MQHQPLTAEQADLAAAHTGLAAAIAGRYRRRLRALDLDDLIQEGLLGLFVAVRHYDADRGVPFGPYAAMWVRSAVLRALTRALKSEACELEEGLDPPAPSEPDVDCAWRERLWEAVERLPPFERWAVCRHYGLALPEGIQGRPVRRRTVRKPLAALGRECGLSSFRMRQVLGRALDTLRACLPDLEESGEPSG